MNFHNYYNSYRINVAVPQNDKTKVSTIFMIVVISLVWVFCYGLNSIFIEIYILAGILPFIKRSSVMLRPTVRSTLPMKTSKRISSIYLSLLTTVLQIITFALVALSIRALLNIIFVPGISISQEFKDLEKFFPLVPTMYQLLLLFNVVLLYYPLNLVRKVKNFYITFATSTALLLGYNCIVRLILKLKISTRILSKEEVLSLENPNSVFVYALIFLGIIAIISFIFCAFVVRKTKQRQYI